MPPEVEKHEVETTEVVKGKVKLFGNPNNPVPVVMARIGKALRYILTGMIVSVSSAPSKILSAEEATAWAWYFGIAILISGGLEIIIGVEPPKKN